MDILVGARLVAPYLAGVSVAVAAMLVAVVVPRDRIGRWLAAFSRDGERADGAVRLCVLFVVATMLLMCGVEVLATLGFLAGLGTGAGDLIVAAGLASVATWFAARALVPRRPRTAWVVVTVALLAAVASSALVAGAFFDRSWDGNTAHQPAVVLLAQGWDPLTHAHDISQSVGQRAAIEFYPKGPWIRDASLYLATGRLETGKAWNLVLFFAVFACWFALMLSLRPDRWWAAVLVGVLAACNPVSVAQAFTFMVDGQLASLFTVAAGLACLVLLRLRGWPVLLALAASLVMLSTAKFTGLVYAAALALGLVVALLALVRDVPRRGAIIAVSAAIAVAALGVGFNPYVLNTVEHGTPFYPIAGAGSVDIISNNAPASFDHLGSLQRLGVSLFSAATDPTGPDVRALTPHLKVPFTVSLSELRPYLAPETHIAGFGPLFGGVLLLAVVGVGLALSDRWVRTRREALVLLGLTALVLVTVLVNPQAWWARYAPQLWLAPVAVAALALTHGGGGGRERWPRALGWVIGVVLLANVTMTGWIGFANVVQATRDIEAGLDRIAAWREGAVLQQGPFETTWIELRERGIRFRLVDDAGARADGFTILYTTAKAYPDR